MVPANIEEAIVALTSLGNVEAVSKGDVLFRQGGPSRGLYIVLEGQLETYRVDDELQTHRILQFSSRGQLAGLTSLMVDEADESLRASVDSKILHIGKELQLQLASGEHQNARDYIALLQNTLLGQHSQKSERNNPLDDRSPIVDAIVQRAVIAQHALQSWPEDQLDEIIRDVADAVNRQAWELADAAINETGMGVVAHRVQKIMLGTMEVAASLQGQPGTGALQIESPHVDAMSVPMGVILGLIPVTNPVETLVFKVLIALKSRNAIVVSSHRKARQVSARTVHIVREVLARYDVNPDLVQTPDIAPRRELTQLLMAHEDISFILATGGSNMVRSAYRSGTPSIGVGKGNAPVWVCKDAHLDSVAEQIVESKAFDNGVVCGSENNLLVDADIFSTFQQSLEQFGAAFLNRKESLRLFNAIFENDQISELWLGKSAQQICQAAGIHRKYPVQLIVVPQDVKQLDSPFLREKLAPIVSCLAVSNDQEALLVTRTILALEGRGHTAIIHTHDQQRISAFASAADVCRVLVNSPGTQGCIGACNGLALSWTLGCGTAGGSSTSDNVTYRHLQNTKRIAHSVELAKEERQLA